MTVSSCPNLTPPSVSPRSPLRISPSRPGSNSTKTPKLVIRVTFPVKISPTFISRVRLSTLLRACSSMAWLTAPMVTVPSSCTSMVAPVSSVMARIIRPPGPIRAPIFSTGIFRRIILGA